MTDIKDKIRKIKHTRLEPWYNDIFCSFKGMIEIKYASNIYYIKDGICILEICNKYQYISVDPQLYFLLGKYNIDNLSAHLIIEETLMKYLKQNNIFSILQNKLSDANYAWVTGRMPNKMFVELLIKQNIKEPNIFMKLLSWFKNKNSND